MFLARSLSVSPVELLGETGSPADTASVLLQAVKSIEADLSTAVGERREALLAVRFVLGRALRVIGDEADKN